jgi:hypothetical protein
MGFTSVELIRLQSTLTVGIDCTTWSKKKRIASMKKKKQETSAETVLHQNEYFPKNATFY